MTFISVITVNLNNSIGLENTLKSYISQNCIFSEIIVIDGNSVDSSNDIIISYSQFIDKCIVESDLGIFDAMNKGITQANGKYIYFLNSGDLFYSPDVLNDFYNIVSTDNNALSKNIICCNMIFTINGEELLIKNNLNSWFVHQSAFVLTDVIKKYFFDINYKFFGDLDLWTRMKINGDFEVYKINLICATMELDGIGSSAKIPFKKIKEKIYFAKKNKVYFNSILSVINLLLQYVLSSFISRKYHFNYFIRFVNFIKQGI